MSILVFAGSAQFICDWGRWRALVVNQLANAVWIISTVLGIMVGQFIPKGALMEVNNG